MSESWGIGEGDSKPGSGLGKVSEVGGQGPGLEREEDDLLLEGGTETGSTLMVGLLIVPKRKKKMPVTKTFLCSLWEGGARVEMGNPGPSMGWG